MTYREFNIYAIKRLAENSEVDNPRFEATHLLCEVCGINETEYLAKRDLSLTPEQICRLEEMLERRVTGEPLQYILGRWDFCGLSMRCGRGCLIPREDTELLVETATALVAKNGRFIDLCTGSGCISVALLKQREDITGVAVDISKQALEYARINASNHKVDDRLEIVCADLRQYTPTGRVDAVISNPPYVKTSDVDCFGKAMSYEPRIAFDGGDDGLDFYRVIIDRYTPFLSENGFFLFEAGYDTTEKVLELMQEKGFESEMRRDINGINRMCFGRRR